MATQNGDVMKGHKNEDNLSQTPSEHTDFCDGAVDLCGVRN